MKICSIQAMIAITLCSLAFAHDNYAQVLDKKITLTLKEVSIEEALDAIENLTNVKFFYSVDQLNIGEKISIEAIDRSLRDLLDELLSPYQIKYKVHERKSTITLKRQPDEPGSGLREVNGEKVRVTASYAADPITGRVTDAATQQPMAGVNIIIKGTTTGTSSDAEGFYTINAENSDILVFSFIGYKTVETSVNGRSVIDIRLEQDIAALKEVVVNAGYWQVKERENTGNIAKLTSDDIAKQPVSTPLQALSGRVPGVIIRQLNGVPGSGVDIQIRGINSLRSEGNNPLYIVDGVPYPSGTLLSLGGGVFGSVVRPINNINPNDIESIEILKDADATAIYGSRGANGVVLITTKKGKSGETSVDFDFSQGQGKVSNMMDLLNTAQYLEMRREAFLNDEREPRNRDYDVNGVWDQTRYTDWQKLLIGGTAHQTRTQTSISAGNSNTQFLLSGSYFRQTSVFPGSFALKRGSGQFNLNHLSMDKRFKAILTLNYVAEKNYQPGNDLTRQAMSLAPNAPKPLDDEGNLNFENATFNDNPFALLLRTYENKTRSLVTNATFEHQIYRNLTLKANLGYNNIDVDELSKNPIRSRNPIFDPTGSTTVGYGNSESWIIEPQVEYNKNLGLSELNLLFGTTFQATEDKKERISASGFISDALLGNSNAAPNTDIEGSDYSEYRYNALYGRIHYKWRDKYIINFTGRRDGSSRFGPGKRFANFGAIGAAWILSSEPFMTQYLRFLSFTKLRASYGITGSDQIGNYEFLETHSATNYPYLGTSGLIPTRLANANFGWETNKKLEVGLEFGFLKDRIMIAGSYYHNRSSNQLVGIPLAGTTGFNSLQANFPAIIQNTGWELEVSAINVDKNGFNWTSSLNLTVPNNKLVEFPNIDKSPFANVYTVGESQFNRKRLRFTGVDPISGMYTFEDANGDGSIGVEDRQSLKEVAAKCYGGVQNNIKFKGLELSFFFQFVSQTGIGYIPSFNRPGQGNQPTYVLERWQQEGDASDIQKFSIFDFDAATAFQNVSSSNYILTDASFIRLQNLSLSYSFLNTLTRKLRIDALRLYIQGQNLLTITNYRGLDPETQSSNSLSPLRILTAGIQVKL